MNHENLPYVSCDQDWIELEAGQQALIAGKINCSQKGSTGILVTTVAWVMFAIEVRDMNGLQTEIKADTDVVVKITRNHDTFSTCQNDITIVNED